MEVKKQDIEFMFENGVSSYLKSKINTIDTIDLLHKFYRFIRITIFAIAKTTVGYYILTKIYDHLGLEKFVLLALAAYITQQIAKEELKAK